MHLFPKAILAETSSNIAVLALLFSGVSVLISTLTLRFSKATKIAEMRKELVIRHVAIRDAIYMMRAHTVLRENPNLEPNMEAAFLIEDSLGFKKAYDEALAKLDEVKKASDGEIIRLYGQELPSLDVLARSTEKIAEEFARNEKSKET